MKQKKLLILFAASALFAACSSDDSPTAPEKQAAQSSEVPVAFDTYVNRGTTRAGATGAINSATTLQDAATNGFGVFAYYTNADNYDQTFTPNFMYNEHLQWTDTEPTDGTPDAWTYTPVKYWPNEFGSNDTHGAASDDVDKVSFFAYAPYAEVTPSSGKVTGDATNATYGIVGMKSNTATGDPMVKYISTFYTDKQVDLMWGVNKGTTWATKNEQSDQPGIVSGKPWLNIQHPQLTSTTWSAAQKVVFHFLHGLASLNVQVDTYADKATPTTAGVSDDPASGTKVYIRSVTFEGFDTKGALNLNNEAAGASKVLWYNFNCEDELNNGNEVTIKDGRKDGKEGITKATKEYAAINPDFVQYTVWGSTTPAEASGVTKTADNLFCKIDGTKASDKTDPIFVIPNGDKLKVTIEYDVLTADPNLVGKLNDGVTPGSVVKNVITRYITADGQGDVTGASAIKLEAGKKYTINLHLGLNSVEFNATVAEWPTAITGGANLPHNN